MYELGGELMVMTRIVMGLPILIVFVIVLIMVIIVQLPLEQVG